MRGALSHVYFVSPIFVNFGSVFPSIGFRFPESSVYHE